MRHRFYAGAIGLLVASASAACGGSTKPVSDGADGLDAAARHAAAIQQRLLKAGYNDLFEQGFLSLLPTRPPKTSFYVTVDYASLHVFNFCVFVFKSQPAAARYAEKIRRSAFRPNPFEPFVVRVVGPVVYWGAGAGKITRQPPPGQPPKYYRFRPAEFEQLVAIAEGARK